MPWSPATFPEHPRGRAVLERVEGAYVTPFERGRLCVVHPPSRWMRGAVHDGTGRLVEPSQRLSGVDGYSPVPADPDTVKVRPQARRLAGTWLYGGHWMGHFGHFLLETVSTLWPEGLPVDGLLFHRNYHVPDNAPGKGFLLTPDVSSWQQRFLELAGYGGEPVRVVRSRPVRVDRLLVPSRSVVFKGWALPEAAVLWRRMAAAAGEPGRETRVFLSRSRFHTAKDNPRRVRTPPVWDAALDSEFAAAGFAVVHPETLPLDDQIRLVRGADVLAGASGSGLHLSAFTRPRTRVLEVGDNRTEVEPMRSQRVVDAVCGHETAFIPYGEPTTLRATLAELGLAPASALATVKETP